MRDAYNFTLIKIYFTYQLTSLRKEAALARCCDLLIFSKIWKPSLKNVIDEVRFKYYWFFPENDAW